MTNNNDRTEDFDAGIGPSGPDAPKVFTGSGTPTFTANEGSRFLCDDGTVFIYKVPPTVPLAGWFLESIDDITEAESFMDSPEEQTTSDGWVSKNNFPFLTENTKTAGKFSIRWSMEVGQTKSDKLFGYRVRWREEGGTWSDLTSIITTVLNNDDIFLQGGFAQVTLPSSAKVEIDVQYGQTTAGFSAILRNVTVEIRRIGD